MQFLKTREAKKAVLASTTDTLDFGPDGIPKRGITAFFLTFIVGAGAFNLSIVQAIRVLVGGKTVINLTPLQLRAYIERFSRANRDPGASAARITIPAYLMDEKGNRRKEVQFEPGNTSVEVDVITGVGVSGDVKVHWHTTDINAKFYTRMIRTAHGHPINSEDDERNRSRSGFIRGFLFPTVGLTNLEMHISGVEVIDADGLAFIESGDNEGDMGIVDPFPYKFDDAQPANDLKFTVTTDGTWDPAGQWVPLLLIPAVTEPQATA